MTINNLDKSGLIICIVGGNNVKPGESHNDVLRMKKKFILLSVSLLLALPMFAQNIFTAAETNDLKGLRFLLNYGVDVNAKDTLGNTALITAVKYNRKEAVEFLVEKDADINLQDSNGNTALILACANSKNMATEMLLNHFADVNIKNNKGATALLTAISTGNLEAVKALVAHGANPKLTDNHHNTAFDYARELDSPEIVNFLNTTATGSGQSAR